MDYPIAPSSHPLVKQLQAEIRELVSALHALVNATGDETYDEGEKIWDRAAELVALHDDDLDELVDPEPLPRQYRGTWAHETNETNKEQT